MRISDWSSDVCSSDLGQRCTNARRLIVKQAMAEPLIEEVRTLSGRLIVDHPHAEPAPYMGPVIDNEAADGLTESFLHLISIGGRSEERRVGKECGRRCTHRWWPDLKKQKNR